MSTAKSNYFYINPHYLVSTTPAVTYYRFLSSIMKKRLRLKFISDQNRYFSGLSYKRSCPFSNKKPFSMRTTGASGPGCSKLGQDNPGLVWNLISDVNALTLYTLSSVYAYSPYCSLYISQGADEENLFTKGFIGRWLFSLFLWPECVNWGWYCKEKLDACPS